MSLDRDLPESPAVIVLGSGFVGSAVRDALEADGDVRVIPMGTSSHPPLGRREAEGAALLRDTIEAEGVAAVINTAGRLRGTDDEMHAANVAWPTWLVGEALVGSGVRFVHLGSAAEYGDPGSAEPVPETAEVNPTGVYGTTKWAGTAAVLKARAGGLDAVVGRGFNLVGPNLAPVSPLYQFLHDVTALPPEGGEVEVWYPGTTRDFILTRDLATAVARLARAEAVPDIVNLCSQASITFGEIVEAMAERARKPVTIRSLDRPGIPAVVGDNARLREVCGIVPQMSAAIIAEHATIGDS